MTSAIQIGTRIHSLFDADIACHPDLDTPTKACCCANHTPTYHRSFYVIKDRQRKLRRGPTYPLKCEEANESSQRWVVGLPSSKKPSCQRETLVSCQNRL